MIRLSALADIPLRLAVAAAWLVAVLVFGVDVIVHGGNIHSALTSRDLRAEGPWEKVTGRVDSVRTEYSRVLGLGKERSIVQYSYPFGGRRYTGQTENFRLWAGSGGADSGSPDYRKGAPIVLWVSERRPGQPQFFEPREPPSARAHVGPFLGYASLLLVATWIAKRIVFRPLPGAEEVLSARGVEVAREQFEAAREAIDDLGPEPADVALPASIRVERIGRGIRVEFPRPRWSVTDVTGLVLTGFMGVSFTVVGVRSGYSLLPLAFGLIVCAFVLRAMRSAFRRCIAEAGPAGLDCRRGYAGFSSRTYIPRLDIDFLEVRPNASGGQAKGKDSDFEIAVVRRDGGGRFVLGENVPGIAAADTLARRIGQALSLKPEQVLGAAATTRRLIGEAESVLGLARDRGHR